MQFSITALTLGSVLIVSSISFLSNLLLSLSHGLVRRMTFLLISFSTGALLGDVFLHIVPELVEEGAGMSSWLLILVGIIASFMLEKFIHWRHCHNDDCGEHIQPVGIMNLIGDAIHNGIDGVLIAGSYLVDVNLGIATTIAVILHEIPQEIGDFGVLIHSGFSRAKAIIFNTLTGLTAIVAAGLILLTQGSADLATWIVPFAAGNFLYIAGSDLIPELHKETRISHSTLQLMGILLGILVMAALLLLE